MVIRADAQSLPTFLILRKQFLETRARATPLTDQEVQTLPHPQCVAILHTAGGYGLFHLGEWERQPVLWVDELFLQPAARKQGLLREFVDWIRSYCEYNGIATVMGMAFSLEEALPLKTHTAVKPVAQILQVPVSALHYRSTEQPSSAYRACEQCGGSGKANLGFDEDQRELIVGPCPRCRGTGETAPLPVAAADVAIVAPKPKRPRKPKVERLLDSGQIQQRLEQEVAGTGTNGTVLLHRSGIEMPLPMTPEHM